MAAGHAAGPYEVATAGGAGRSAQLGRCGVIVFGANGALGRRLIVECLERGLDVSAAVATPRASRASRARSRRHRRRDRSVRGRLCRPPGTTSPSAPSLSIRARRSFPRSPRPARRACRAAGGRRGWWLPAAPASSRYEPGHAPDGHARTFTTSWKPRGPGPGRRARRPARGRDRRRMDLRRAPAPLLEPGERTGEYRSARDELLTDDDGRSRITMEDFAIAMVDEALERQAPAGAIYGGSLAGRDECAREPGSGSRSRRGRLGVASPAGAAEAAFPPAGRRARAVSRSTFGRSELRCGGSRSPLERADLVDRHDPDRLRRAAAERPQQARRRARSSPSRAGPATARSAAPPTTRNMLGPLLAAPPARHRRHARHRPLAGDRLPRPAERRRSPDSSGVEQCARAARRPLRLLPDLGRRRRHRRRPRRARLSTRSRSTATPTAPSSRSATPSGTPTARGARPRQRLPRPRREPAGIRA